MNLLGLVEAINLSCPPCKMKVSCVTNSIVSHILIPCRCTSEEPLLNQGLSMDVRRLMYDLYSFEEGRNADI